MMRVFASAPSGSLFLDIGSAIGYYAILIKMRWPDARVIAVDALPRHMAAMRANMELNGLAPTSIELCHEAVGTASGDFEFADAGYGSALATTIPASRRSRLDLIKVATRPLSAILRHLPPVHLMKMDIQGSELEVLRAARDSLTNGRVLNALIGTHGCGAARRRADTPRDLWVPRRSRRSDATDATRWHSLGSVGRV